jgi:hypothetical protein
MTVGLRGLYGDTENLILDRLRYSVALAYEFRSGINITSDLSGNNSHATVIGSPSLLTGGFIDNLCLQNMGSNGALQIPYNNFTSTGDKSFSIAVLFRWTYTGTSVTGRQIFCADQFASSQREFSLSIEYGFSSPNYTLALFLSDQSTTTNIGHPVSPSSFASRSWHLAVAMFNEVENRILMYFDGSIISSYASSPNVLLYRPNNINIPRFIGSRRINSNTFESDVPSDVFFQYLYKWDRLLTTNELDFLWNNGDLRFLFN